jgi:hypothetical protein
MIVGIKENHENPLITRITVQTVANGTKNQPHAARAYHSHQRKDGVFIHLLLLPFCKIAGVLRAK